MGGRPVTLLNGLSTLLKTQLREKGRLMDELDVGLIYQKQIINISGLYY